MKRIGFKIHRQVGIAWLLFSFSFLSSCSFYKDVEVVEIHDLKFRTFDQQGLKAEIYLEINNPNWYRVVLKESHVNLFLDGKSLGELRLANKVSIPANSADTQMLVVETDYEHLQHVLGNMITLLFKKEFKLEGKGYIKGRVLFLSKQVPVSFNESVSKEALGF